MKSTPINWNAYAAVYDVLMQLTPYRELHKNVTDAVIRMTPALCYDESKVLDAACGTGNQITNLRARGIPASNIIGVDVSPIMCACARGKHGYAGVQIHTSDLNIAQPYPAGSFLCIVCVNALYAVEDPAATLRDFARILAPGGTLVLANPHNRSRMGLILKAHAESKLPDSFWEQFDTNPEIQIQLLHMATAHSGIPLDLLKRALSSNKNIVEGPKHFLSAEHLTELITSAGFDTEYVGTAYAEQAVLVCARKRDDGNAP